MKAVLSNEDRMRRRRISKKKWRDKNPEIMQQCRDSWTLRNADRILLKRRERSERITGRKVIPRGTITEEQKRAKAKIRSSRWYHANKNAIRQTTCARSKRYYRLNRDKIRQRITSPEEWARQLQRQKIWRSKNPERMRNYSRKRSTQPQQIIRQRLCARIGKMLKVKGARRHSRVIELVGCSWAFLKSYIESRFVEGMSWENRFSWHLDHKRPCASFDLRDPQQQRDCFHFTNLQPLWSEENMAKGAKWNDAA